MEFSSNLRYLRKERGMSQDELADKLGYKSFTTIQKWESGVSEPSVSTLEVIANIFGVSMDQMINQDLSVPSSSSATPLQLTEQEERLVVSFRGLNDEGREKAAEYMEDLTDMKKYQSDLSPVEQARRDADEIVRQEGVNPIADCNDDDYERKLPSLFSKTKKKAEVF